MSGQLRLQLGLQSTRKVASGDAKQMWGKFKWRFSTNISLYLRNGARYGHSYYGMPLYVLYRLVLFPVTVSDPYYLKPPHFNILYRLSYLRNEWSRRLQIW